MATRIASARARTPTTSTVPPGTVGAGTALMSAGEEVPEHPAQSDPDGDPDGAPDDGGDAGLHGHGDGELAPGEAERLEDGQVVPSAPDRRHERDAERGRGADRQGGAQQQRRGTERSVVQDLGRAEHPEHGAAVDGRCPPGARWTAATPVRRGCCPPLSGPGWRSARALLSKRFRAGAGMIR